MRPASGPPTFMWAWPAGLVAAIFQPTTLRPAAAGSSAWIAWPSARVEGRRPSGSVSSAVPASQCSQSRRAARPGLSIGLGIGAT